MRYPAALTAERHERIVDSAARLFRERGFSGVNVAQVMADAHLTHGGFYAHFSSKDRLAAAAVERALLEMSGHLEDAAAGADPQHIFVDRYLTHEHRDNPGHGCVAAALGTDIGRADVSVRDVFTKRLTELFEQMASVFGSRDGARTGAINDFATIVGAIVLARAVNDDNLSSEIIDAVRNRFGLPPEGSRSDTATGSEAPAHLNLTTKPMTARVGTADVRLI